jgi:hypothetical protein
VNDWLKTHMMADRPTYMIRRHHFRGSPEILKTGLTLEEAQEHCEDPETSSETATSPEAREYTKRHGPWFDGYTEE